MSTALTPSSTITSEVNERPTRAFQNTVPIPQYIRDMLYLDDEVTTSAAAGKKKRINTKFYKSVSEKLETMTDIERKEDLKQKLASVKQLKYYADPNDMLDLKTTFAM